MAQDVKEWTETCLQCVCAKAGPEVRAPLVSTSTSYSFEVVGVDYLSLGCPDDRYPYVLVMTDLFSKHALAVPTKDQSANTTLSRHLRGNGACERFNQTFLKLLSSLTETDQAQWHNRLPARLQAYNSTIHSTTGMTPHYVVFGRHTRLPVDLGTGFGPTVETHTLQGWVQQHQKALIHAYQTAKRQSQHQQERDQVRYNRQTKVAPLLPGERVFLRNFRRRARGKLTPRWSPEPFVVVKQLRENLPVYILRPEGKEAPTQTVHRNNLRPCPLNMLQDTKELAGESELPRGELQEEGCTLTLGCSSFLPPAVWIYFRAAEISF
uniref:Integrase catalytic domain-containing protein n=1 Tax=Stegastes partitus TaxID=144197 RepID=A0A3B4ZGR3_9TELE